VPDAARLAGVEGRAGVGNLGRPVFHRTHRDRRQHARRGRRVQQLQAPVAHQHLHRFAGRVRPHGRRGRVAVQCHLGGVQGNDDIDINAIRVVDVEIHGNTLTLFSERTRRFCRPPSS